VELTTFRLRDGVDEAAFLEADAAVQAFAHVQPGLIRRTTAREAAGGDDWLVLTLWGSWELADAAVEAERTSEVVQAFLSFIEPDSLQVRRFDSLPG
jgi:hypothetical protein